MENYKTPEEILAEQYACSSFDDLKQKLYNNGVGSIDMIIDAMSRYGKQQYNKAVFDCAEKAYKQMYDIGEYEEVVKESILELIKE